MTEQQQSQILIEKEKEKEKDKVVIISELLRNVNDNINDRTPEEDKLYLECIKEKRAILRRIKKI